VLRVSGGDFVERFRSGISRPRRVLWHARTPLLLLLSLLAAVLAVGVVLRFTPKTPFVRPALAGWNIGQPAAAINSNGQVAVFWAGGDGNLYEVQGPANGTLSSPVNLGMGPLGSAPTAAIDGSGNAYVYWKGTDGNLWQAYSSGGRWLGPYSRGFGTLGSQPAVAVTPSGTAYVFWKGTTGDLYQVQGPANGSLSQLTDLGMGPLGSAPTVGIDSNGYTYVYWEGSSGSNYALWEGYWNGSRWVGPSNRGMAPLGSQPSVAVTGSATAYPFWKGTTNDLYEAQGPANGALSGPYDVGMGPLGSAPSAVVDSSGATYVYWAGTNGDLYEGYWNGLRWVGPIDRTLDPPNAPTAVSATAADSRAIASWTAPSSPSAITKYTVTPYIGSVAQTSLAVSVTAKLGANVTTTANVGGLSDGTTYTFQVTATSANGTGPPGASGPAVPARPAPLTITKPSGYDSSSTPQHVVAADLNHDGWPDVVTPNVGSNFSILLNQVRGGGQVGGTLSQPAALPSANGSVSAVAFGDFNGDGRLDAAVVHRTTSVGVMLQHADGTFGGETPLPLIPNSEGASMVAVGDINGDGRPDIVAGGLQCGTQQPCVFTTAVNVFIGNGDGTFQSPAQYQIGDGAYNEGSGLVLTDLNGDGRLDVVYASNNAEGGSTDTGSLYVLMNQGPGVLAASAQVATIPGPHSAVAGESLAVADLNGDGRKDIVVSEDPTYVSLNGSGGQRGVSILFGNGDGTFTAPVYVRDPALTDGASPPNDAGDVQGIAVKDMNGDGIPDIVSADSGSFSGNAGFSVYLNPGGGSINSPTFIPTAGFSPHGLTLADLNGDGETDVVLENNSATGQGVPANILVLLNGTDFPPLGGPLGPNEMHGCAMCQALRGGGTLAISGSHPITVNSGEMSHTFTDITIPARGYPLSVTQTYNDLNAGTDAGLGYGWWSPLLMSLSQNASTGLTTVTQEDGAQAQFWTSSLQPVAPRTQATLVHNGGTWTFTRYKRDTFSFNSAGQITSMADLTGDILTFGYTGSQVTSLTHSDGRSLAIGWSNGHITSITDSNVSGTSRSVSLTYDGGNQLTDIDWKVNGSNDRNEHFEYETTPWNHGMTGMRDPRGIWVTQAYDSTGHTTAQTIDPTSKNPNGLNRTTTYAYTLNNGAISQVLITDPAGHQELDSFAYGELVQKVMGYGTSSAASWSYAYDPSSLGTRTTADPNGHVSTASFDSFGNELAAVDPLGRVTAYTYSGNGGADAQFNQPTTMTDANGVSTTYSYDGTYRTLTQTSTPLVGASPPTYQVVQYQHSNSSHRGDVTAMVDGDGKTWTYGYDTYGDKTSSTDPQGDKSSSAYNADGWLLSSLSPKGDPSVCQSPCTPAQYTTTYAYTDGSGATNFWGKPTTITDPLGHQTLRVYDNDNNVTQLTDGNGNVTNYDYDDANELTVTHRPDAGHTTTVIDYNLDGTVADQKDGLGNTIQSYAYNSLAQATSITVDPGSSPHLNQTTSYGYDGVGNLLSKQNPGGSCTGNASGCTTYTYDAANQLTSITYSDGITPNVSNIRYDGDGQRIAMSDGSGNWSWQYDSLHRLTSVTEGRNGTIAYQYNLRNEVTALAYPNAVGTVSRGYDNAGRWTSVQDWNGAQTTFAYDSNSNLQSETMPTTGTSVVDSFTYNTADQLTAVSDAQGANTIFSASYSRDGNGQLTADSSAAANQASYAYTSLNQVCYAGSSNGSACSSPPSGSEPFAYDAAGNLTTLGSTAQTFNTANQVLTSGTGSFQYDNRGNRTSMSSGGSTTNYRYDQANRLCLAGPASASCNGSVPTTDTAYCYNGDGLRMLKVTAGSCTAPTTSEPFSWDQSGQLPLLLTDGSTNYLYGPGGLPLEQVNGATTLWYQHDQIGSTRAITDNTGVVKATYVFDPYGNILSSTGTLPNQPLLFGGEYRDSESSVYYLRARYYDPTTGQFLSRDPAVATTREPYAYVGDNPMNFIDPVGLAGIGGDGTLSIADPLSDATNLIGAGVAGLIGLWVWINTPGQAQPFYAPQPGPAPAVATPTITVTPPSTADDTLGIGGKACLWLFAKRADLRQVNDTAQRWGIRGAARREFGRYIEDLKGGGEDLTWRELQQAAQDFLDEQGRGRQSS
jgi:RHS repeat-associated protein